MKIAYFFESTFNLRVCQLIIYKDDEQIYIHETKERYTFRNKIKYMNICVDIAYNRASPLTEDEKGRLSYGAAFYAANINNEIVPYSDCIEVLEAVLKNGSLDDLIYMIVDKLVKKCGLKRVGVFLLNEALLRLKGVMYADNDGSFNLNNLQFKSSYISLKEITPITNAMFYERVEEVNLKDIEHNGLDRYFNDSLIVCGIFSKKAPFGVIIGEPDRALDSVKENMFIYSMICSIGLELSNSIRKLEFANYEIDYFKHTLESASEFTSMGKIAASVAHELKNPLVSIGGFARRLEKLIKEEKGSSYLNIIISEVSRLEKIVSEMLVYSKILSVNKEKCNLYNVFTEVLELLTDTLSRYHIDVEVLLDNTLEIYIDEKKMIQVFINILNNSIQAMSIGSGTIYVRSIEYDNSVSVIVRDNGGGIDEELIDKIFEPFFSTKESGTGLGLSICKKIIAAHSGEIKIRNFADGVEVEIIIPKVRMENGAQIATCG